jgi:hypothetical protein
VCVENIDTVHTRIHTRAHTHIHPRTHTHTHTHTRTIAHTRTHTCMREAWGCIKITHGLSAIYTDQALYISHGSLLGLLRADGAHSGLRRDLRYKRPQLGHRWERAVVSATAILSEPTRSRSLIAECCTISTTRPLEWEGDSMFWFVKFVLLQRNLVCILLASIMMS